MKRNFPEVATAWEWVQENQDKFEKEVFGPPMISCSVKDERYSDQIQSLLQMDDFTCFTAQTKNDYKKLSDQLYRNMSLSVVIRSCPHALANFQRPVSPEETKTLGLDGFAIDFLDGPDAVLAMLCSEKRLNSSGVSLHDHSDDQYERIVNSIRISQWAAGKQSYTVRRRKEYGPQAMTTITKNIQAGRFWTSQPVDSQEKVELTRQMNEKRGEKDLLRTENNEIKEKLNGIAEQKREINKKIVSFTLYPSPLHTQYSPAQDELRSEKNALQRDFQKYQSLPDKIGTSPHHPPRTQPTNFLIQNPRNVKKHPTSKPCTAPARRFTTSNTNGTKPAWNACAPPSPTTKPSHSSAPPTTLSWKPKSAS